MLDPVVVRAEEAGVSLFPENIEDVDPSGTPAAGHKPGITRQCPVDRHGPRASGPAHVRRGVLRALDETDSAPHLMLELRKHKDIPRLIGWLQDRGLSL